MSGRGDAVSRRRQIEAAIAAHNSNDREQLLLPPDAVRLLTLMFRRDAVCRGLRLDLELAFGRRTVDALLRTLTETGFVSKETVGNGSRRPATYHLHLPPRRP